MALSFALKISVIVQILRHITSKHVKYMRYVSNNVFALATVKLLLKDALLSIYTHHTRNSVEYFR